MTSNMLVVVFKSEVVMLDMLSCLIRVGIVISKTLIVLFILVGSLVMCVGLTAVGFGVVEYVIFAYFDKKLETIKFDKY